MGGLLDNWALAWGFNGDVVITHGIFYFDGFLPQPVEKRGHARVGQIATGDTWSRVFV